MRTAATRFSEPSDGQIDAVLDSPGCPRSPPLQFSFGHWQGHWHAGTSSTLTAPPSPPLRPPGLYPWRCEVSRPSNSTPPPLDSHLHRLFGAVSRRRPLRGRCILSCTTFPPGAGPDRYPATGSGRPACRDDENPGRAIAETWETLGRSDLRKRGDGGSRLSGRGRASSEQG